MKKTPLIRKTPLRSKTKLKTLGKRGLRLIKEDAAWSAEVAVRDGFTCQVCGSRDGVDAHHIKSRRYLSTRHDIDNGIALCRVHHDWAHNKPKEFKQWLEER